MLTGPVAARHDAQPEAALPCARAPFSDQSLSDSQFRARPRVLLVEDNRVNMRVAARMLERLGCVVDVAENGVEALQALEEARYAVTFMDCQMPRMDGFEAVRRLRLAEQASGQHATVVALTANAMPGDLERCLAAGMDDYLSKPLRIEALEQVLTRWVLRRA